MFDNRNIYFNLAIAIHEISKTLDEPRETVRRCARKTLRLYPYRSSRHQQLNNQRALLRAQFAARALRLEGRLYIEISMR